MGASIIARAQLMSIGIFNSLRAGSLCIIPAYSSSIKTG